MPGQFYPGDYENMPYPMPRQFCGARTHRGVTSPGQERYWVGGRVFSKDFMDRVKKDPRRRMAEDLRVIFETLRILPEMMDASDGTIRHYCQTARYEFRHKNDILYCRNEFSSCWYLLLSGAVYIDDQMFLPGSSFGKRSASGSSGPRRENECLILEPSEMLVFDYPETQTSKGSLIHPVPNTYHQQTHQRILPVPGNYPNHFSYYPQTPYGMDQSVMLREHARMVESEDHYRNDLHTLLVRGQCDLYAKSQRSSRGSDTSSAYSGSDTLHSVQSSIEAEHDADNDIDLSGLKESLVDSDEEDDLADMGTVVVRDTIQLCLEKDPADRTDEDVEILIEFTQQLKAFSNMTLSVRKAMCRVMVFAVVEHPGTVVMNDNEELDSWSVIVNGQVEIDYGDGTVQTLGLGDSFGITPTMDKLYHRGVMRTKCSDCQFVCITQQDYYRILHQGEENTLRIEEDGRVVQVIELRPIPGQGPHKAHIVIKGTVEKLMTRLILDDSLCDPTYVEDFLLTHRTFIDSPLTLCKQLLEWFQDVDLRDKVTRVVLLWVTNHFTDFETDPAMIDFLEKFEQGLEQAKMLGQLRLLNFACAAKARNRTLTLTRSSRDEPLQFSVAGGFEKGSFIFVSKVEKGSKAEEIGLKRGDQIVEVNGQSFQHITSAKALEVLKGTTHLSITVKSNLLGFKEMLTQPQGVDLVRRGKKDPANRGRSDTRNRISSVGDEIDGAPFPRMLIDEMPCSISPVRDKKNENCESQKTRFMTLGHKTKLKKVLKKIYMYQNKGAVSDHSSDDSSFPDVHRSAAPSPLYHSHSNPDLTSIYYEERRVDYPEHVLKIYRADQSCKYLLVNKETTAHEVVMLAIREFGITEPSNIYSLCEVSVSEGGIVKQRRLPDQLQNLAERIGLASRYYLKSNTSTEPLVPDELASEIIREAQVNFLQLQAVEVAVQLTLEDFSIFRQVESTEFIDDLFGLKSKYGTPQLSLFEELVNREMFWVVTEVCSESNLIRRTKIVKQFIKIARQCKECKNFNSMFAIISGLGYGAVSRLRATWDRLPTKYQNLFKEMEDIMNPIRNMSKYRHLVNSENLQPPVIPVYPVVKKDLTFIHLGNDTHVDGLVNFEKLRMIAKEVRTLSHMCSVPYDLFTMLELGGHTPSQAMMAMNQLTAAIGSHSGNSLSAATVKRRKKSTAVPNQKKMFEEAQMVRRVKAYLSKMKVIRDEELLRQMSLEVEPPSGGSSHNSAHNTTTTSVERHAGILASHHRKRHPSPTLSTASTNSSTSANSEGRKTSQSGPKFGAASPQSVKKILALSEPSKTRPYQPPKPTGLQNPHALSPSPSPNIHRRGREAQRSHERSHSDTMTLPVDLSAESSSVTSLSNLPVRKTYPGSSEGSSIASLAHNLTGMVVNLGTSTMTHRSDIDPGYCTQFESRSSSSLEAQGPPSPTVKRQMPVVNRPRRPPEYTVAVSSSMSRMAHLNRSRSHDGMFQSDDEDDDGAQVSTV